MKERVISWWVGKEKPLFNDFCCCICNAEKDIFILGIYQDYRIKGKFKLTPVYTMRGHCYDHHLTIEHVVGRVYIHARTNEELQGYMEELEVMEVMES